MWESTGGNAVTGDDSLTTALKETQEELGVILEPQNGQLVKHYLLHNDIGSSGLADIWLFRQSIDISTIILAPDETCGAMWAKRDKINRMIDEGIFKTWGLFTHIDELFESAQV